MLIISFAETSEALLAGRKTCTRRAWKMVHAHKFHRDQVVQAYSKIPIQGGKRIALIRLTEDPSYSSGLVVTDWEAEGFGYMSEHGLTLFGGKTPEEVWAEWSKPYGVAGLYVIRFEVLQKGD